MACASTVAVVVPSPAVSDVLLATSRTICAPMFCRVSLRSISFATVTPSLVIVGDPNFLSRTTLRPFGPSVTFTASASWLTPLRIDWRACSPYTICFAIDMLLNRQMHHALTWSTGALLLGFLGLGLVDHGEHFVLAHDEKLFAVQLDLLPRVLPEEDQVAGLHIQGDALAVVLDLSGTGRDDLALLRLFLGRVRDDDASDLLFAFLDALDNDPVVQRSDVHAHFPVFLK